MHALQCCDCLHPLSRTDEDIDVLLLYQHSVQLIWCFADHGRALSQSLYWITSSRAHACTHSFVKLCCGHALFLDQSVLITARLLWPAGFFF